MHCIVAAADMAAPGCTIPVGALNIATLVDPPSASIDPGTPKDFTLLGTATNLLPICAAGGHTLRVPVSLDGTT